MADVAAPLVALVVDDELPVLDEVCECVRRDGRVGAVLAAASSVDALRILMDQPMIDLVFLDIKMPSVDGLQLARFIAELRHAPKIIFVTAHASHVGDAFDLHAVDYVLKPMHEERISQAISRALASREADDVRGRVVRSLQAIGGVQRLAKQEEIERSSPKVFISYSRGDFDTAHELYVRLSTDGVACWFDQDLLMPGQNWRNEITRAIRRCAFFLVCLSEQSIAGPGYRHVELEYAVQVAMEQPEDSIFIVPARIEPCELPGRLKHLHAVNLYESDGYDRILRVLRKS